MAGIFATLADRLRPAFAAVAEGADPVLRPSAQAGADFQANGALPLAKRTGRPPAEVAAQVLAAADLDGVATAEVHPKGFVNLRVDDAHLATALTAMGSDPRRGVDPVARPWTVVVDYSAPNVAKEMHAGHVRTTFVGDALCRIAGFAGHHVVRENHIGDWGTPFGMLIEHLVDLGEDAAIGELSVGDLDGFYKQARAAFDASPDLQERARRRVVMLQAGDAETLRLWRVLVDESMRYFHEVYRRLGVGLGPADVVGESFYNDLLPGVVDDLRAGGLLVESDGAQCVFPPGFTGRDGDPLPLIVQKSDGGFGYAATDLAALKDRFGRLGADRALYVVGAPQAQHFAMCFAVGRMVGYVPEGAEPVHVQIGNMLGSDRKIFRTRSGDTVKLIDLVDEAVARAAAALAGRGHDLGDDEAAHVAEMVGVGALKYADLSTDRAREYVFDWDRMLSFDGNSAPYLQYAHARIQSIFRRGGVDGGAFGRGATPVTVAEPAERALALRLLGLDEAIDAALATWSPHKLCAYLYDLAGDFTTFFEHCPVLRADDPALRASRLELCALTADVLASGLRLLGIEAPERM
ncbi:MAG TPA: arginine--tRNA ligase [Acidimicrobiales bacterium]|nr:arginine--tRNA ligase [Acidimicrobiales bacterium]